MGTIVKITNKIGEKKHCEDDNLFLEEFTKGYLELELNEKIERLSEYLYAYREIDDKNTYNAQYLESLIELFKKEIKSYFY
ncbi:MAG: hypothetical protein ACFE8J_15200 [Candidatus Heimdallarchaeota archaeon]